MPVIIIIILVLLFVILWRRNKEQLNANIQRQDSNSAISYTPSSPTSGTQARMNNQSSFPMTDRIRQSASEPPKVTEDLVKTIYASDHGDDDATEKIHKMWETYENPIMTRLISEARLQAYSSLAASGDKEAKRWIGFSYFSLGQENQGYTILSELSRQNDVEAIKLLAYQYSPFGYYGDQPEKYLDLMLKAAELGDAEAQTSVGIELNAAGKTQEALMWFTKAAKQEYPKAYKELADAYEYEAIHLDRDITNPDLSEQQRHEASIKAKEYRESAVYWAKMAMSNAHLTFEESIPILRLLGILLQDRSLSSFNPNMACMAFAQASAMCKRLGKLQESQQFQEDLNSVEKRFSLAISEQKRKDWVRGIE